MTCKLVMTLLTESQEGECGEDWKYEVEAKVFDEGLKGEASVSVPKHNLAVGATEPCFGNPEPVTGL